jgi:hypothetical protein
MLTEQIMTGRFLRTGGGAAVRYRNPDGRRLGVPCDLHGEEAALTAGRVLDRIGRQLDGHTNPSTMQVLYSGLTRFFLRLCVKGEWTS